MPEQIPFFNWSLSKVLEREDDPIVKARVKMIVYSLMLGLLITLILIPYYAVSGPHYQFLRSLVLVPVFVFLIKLQLARRIWRETLHISLLMLTALIFSNLFFKKSVSAVTVQYAVLVILYSLYGLGRTWGIIYSAVNVLAILVFIVFGREVVDPAAALQLTGRPAFILVLAIDFVLIFLAHYLFYRAFYNSILELKKAVKAKSDFMSTMSHEMRTPLNAVIGMASLMVADQRDQQQNENLKILKFSAESLLTVINDVLDFSKMESGKIEMEQISFNIASLLENICSGMKIQAVEKGLEFKLTGDERLQEIWVSGDSMRFTQVMYNLIGNAIKFTPKGSVTVNYRIVEQIDRQVRVYFSVADTGIGISKDKQQLIFQPFTQASRNTTREFGGTGLGLSIVTRLLELFNSKMNLVSQAGGGSDFSFEMLFDPGTPPAGQLEQREEPPFPKMFNVLLAEDNMINVLLVKKLLNKWWNIAPMVAENGAVALQLVELYHFDIILMDMHMPVMDGYEAVKRIRALPDPVKASTYIMALTASVSTLSELDAVHTGINDYLSKPFNPTLLKEKIERVIRNREELA